MESDSEDELIADGIEALLLLKILSMLKRNTKKKTRRWWVRPIYANRERQGHFNNLVEEMRLHDTESFFQFTRMTHALFDELCRYTFEALRKRSIRPSISPAQRIMITLRYLSTGESLQSLAFNFRCGRSTVSMIVTETCEVLWTILSPGYLPALGKIEWQHIADDFEGLWQFPHCLGAIDGKHVTIECPANTGSQFFNYKKSFSIVLMATCDAKYRFTTVDIGGMGSQSDGGIFAVSPLGKLLLSDALDIPEPKPLAGQTEDTPYCFVGDEAFPLKPNLMRPFPGERRGGLPTERRIFNYRLSRARRVIENTFGVLVARWRIFRTPIKTLPNKVDGIVKAAVCLHNWLNQHNIENYMPPNFTDSADVSGMWRSEVDLDSSTFRPGGPLGSNNRSLVATLVRDRFLQYFNSEIGAVPWQAQAIMRGTTNCNNL